MHATTTPLKGLLVLEPVVHGDARGFFMEAWNRDTFTAVTGVDAEFVQDNHSRSSHGVLRGLHYQVPPTPQGKLVRVVRGTVWDVAVDIRRSSPTFGKWFGIELSEDNRIQLWVPPGFAHWFVVLTDTADLVYKVSGRYDPSCDRAVRWDDPDLAIAWPLSGEPVLSAKDAAAPFLADADVFD
jgi:dTDP-4-dehydrorhamnose 3,5-epimerase